jgi:hypothetical protein
MSFLLPPGILYIYQMQGSFWPRVLTILPRVALHLADHITLNIYQTGKRSYSDSATPSGVEYEGTPVPGVAVIPFRQPRAKGNATPAGVEGGKMFRNEAASGWGQGILYIYQLKCLSGINLTSSRDQTAVVASLSCYNQVFLRYTKCLGLMGLLV